MTGKIDVSHGGEQQGPHNVHQSPQHLDEIALKPNPLTQRKVDMVKPFYISLEGTGRHTTTCGPP